MFKFWNLFHILIFWTKIAMQCIDRWMLEQSALSSKMEWLIVSGHESSKKNFTVAENKLLAFFCGSVACINALKMRYRCLNSNSRLKNIWRKLEYEKTKLCLNCLARLGWNCFRRFQNLISGFPNPLREWNMFQNSMSLVSVIKWQMPDNPYLPI